jgi:hypothetical protein
MLEPGGREGNVQMHIFAELPEGDGWFAECGIGTIAGSDTWGETYCFDTAWPWQAGHNYNAVSTWVEIETWHTFRIEIDPATMTFSYYIDDQPVGSHVPVDAEQLQRADLTFYVGVWSAAEDPITGHIDDVRVGPLAQ